MLSCPVPARPTVHPAGKPRPSAQAAATRIAHVVPWRARHVMDIVGPSDGRARWHASGRFGPCRRNLPRRLIHGTPGASIEARPKSDFPMGGPAPALTREDPGRMALRIKSRGGESVDQMMRRFKKLCEKEGLTKDIRRKEFYEKPSERRRRSMRKGETRRIKEAGSFGT